MLKSLPGTLKGLILLLLLGLNTILCSLAIYPIILIKILAPTRELYRWSKRKLVGLGEKWIEWNSLGIKAFMNTEWNVQGLDKLNPHESYLVVANHQSWVDIFILQFILNRKIPFIRFFLKFELIYIPLLGGAWWALDFPFMKRHSKEYLKAHPEKRGEDLETTKKSCRRFKNSEVSILNFLEGTRFEKNKYLAQGSPYRHLLKPKTGGVAFVIQAMGEQIHSVVDVSIFYTEGPVSFWEFLKGKLKKVEVLVREYKIPESFKGRNYLTDEKYREDFQHWIQGIWQDKDEWLESTAKKYLPQN